MKTACRICISFCGIDVESDGDKVLRIRPDKDNPYNWADFCTKGGSANQLRDHPLRITTPMKRVGHRYVAVDYPTALREIAANLNEIRRQHGANSIASYVGNPGMLNSTGHAFHTGFVAALGSRSNYHVGSVDQNAQNLVARQMFGSDLVALTPDVDTAQFMMFLGANPAVSYLSWMYAVTGGWKRVLEAQRNGAYIVMVDPRETASTKKADAHVKVCPGEDWALLLAMINTVFNRGWEHRGDCDDATGLARIRQIAAEVPIEYLAARCGVPVAQIVEITERFALARTGFCVTNTGVSHNRNGTLGEWLGLVLNLVLGRIDRPGGRVYQKGIFKNGLRVLNKMSPKPSPPSRIGGFEAVQGGYPIAILPEEITTPGEGQVKALVVYGGNPVVSGPDGARLDEAMKQLDCLIAVDFFQRESHRHAHWLIPGTHFLERDDFFAMMGSLYDRPYAQLSPAVVPPRNGIMPEWQFFRDLAVEMKIPFMGVPGLNALIKLSRRVAERTGNPRLSFNPRWVWAALVRTMSCLRWRDLVNKPSGYFYAENSFGHLRRLLQTQDGRINAAPEKLVEVLRKRLAEPLPASDPHYPLQLVNQRHLTMMNSWLVETVKRRIVRGEFVEISPVDAQRRGLVEGQDVVVSSATAKITTRARITTDVPAGVVSMDHGWGSRLFDPQFGHEPQVQGVNRNQLVSGHDIDELSGIPDLNGTRVEVCAVRSS